MRIYYILIFSYLISFYGIIVIIILGFNNLAIQTQYNSIYHHHYLQYHYRYHHSKITYILDYLIY